MERISCHAISSFYIYKATCEVVHLKWYKKAMPDAIDWRLPTCQKRLLAPTIPGALQDSPRS